MKITFVLPGIGPAGGIRAVYEYANRLQKKRHQVTIVFPVDIHSCSVSERCVNLFKNIGVRPHVTWFDVKAKMRSVHSTTRLAIAQDYIPDADIIIATWWETAHCIAGYSEKKGKKVYFIQDYEVWGGPETEVDRTYTLASLHKIVTSWWLKKTIEKKFSVQTIGPIAYGVNFDMFHEDTLPRDLKTKRIGMIYSLQKRKGMADGIKAFEIVRSICPDVALVLIGTDRGNDIPTYAEFHENPSQKELRKIYNSLDIFMMPSLQEGFGMPPMEAMACKVPCVLTNVGAVAEYTQPGITALVSEPGQPQALAGNLLYLLKDCAQRNKIASEGNRYIQQFTWEKATENFEKALIEILGKI